MKTYPPLVFDIDGTLVNSLPVHMVSLKATLRELTGKEYAEENLGFTFGIPGVDSMRRLGLPDPVAAQKLWTEWLHREGGGGADIPLFPGVQEILDELRERDVHLGIVTSKTWFEYETQFRANGLLPYFDTVVTASDTQKGKPNPDPMFAYLHRTGAAPEDVLFFGDTAYDMDCARGAGVDHALALWGCLNPEGIEATYRLAEVQEILDFAK